MPPSHAALLVGVAQRALAEDWISLRDYTEAACEALLGGAVVRLLQACPDGRFEVVGRDGEVGARSDEATALRAIQSANEAATLDEATSEALAALCTIAPAPAWVVPIVGAKTYLLAAFRSPPLDEAEYSTLTLVADLLVRSLRRRDLEYNIRRREAQTRAILRTTVDGIITIDEHGAIQSMNPAAERIFGFVAEEIIGCNVKVLMPSPYYEEHDGYMAAYRETGHRRIIGIGREVSGQRKNGDTFPMDLSVSEVRAADGTRTFTGLIRDISARRELEAEVLRIADDERRRIGQDLHDGLGQMLTGTHLIARGLARQLSADASERAADADELAGLIKDADSYARALARGLVPVELEAHGLAAALKRLAANAERLFSITCTFELSGSGAGDVGEAPEVPAATHLFRIAQESVSNAVQHGQAQQVSITLVVGTDQVRLRVDDDGIGIDETIRSGASEALADTGARRDSNRGMGVRIMHYRARIAQGSLELRPGATGGTTVLCTIPLR
ncbi:MAG: PAS domain S-box protein [Bacteroidota bacterium]